jgi:hypothetical protein
LPLDELIRLARERGNVLDLRDTVVAMTADADLGLCPRRRSAARAGMARQRPIATNALRMPDSSSSLPARPGNTRRENSSFDARSSPAEDRNQFFARPEQKLRPPVPDNRSL